MGNAAGLSLKSPRFLSSKWGPPQSLAWDRPDVTVETRKKIIRMLISEIVVDITDDTITTIIHWHGGDHTRLETPAS